MWWLSDVKLISGACRARVAIVCCRVEMVSDPGMSGIVPLRRSAIRCPLPSTGSSRVSSPASPVLRGIPTACRPSRRASLPSLGGTALCARASLPSAAERSHRRPGASFTRLSLVPVTARRRQALPGSWGTPLCTCPALRPRWDLHARPSRRFGAAFRHYYRVGSHHYHFRGSIARPAHSLSTLRNQGHPCPRKTRFRPLARLCRAGLLTRWVPSQGFRAAYISSSLPRLLLAHSSPGEQAAACDYRKTRALGREQAAACDYKRTRELGCARMVCACSDLDWSEFLE